MPIPEPVLGWSYRYRRTIEALGELKVKSAYLDGELCALNDDGVPVFSRLQAAMDEGRTDQLVFFAFDLLFLNGRSTTQLPLFQRKDKLKKLLKKEIAGLRYSEHVAGDGASTPASWVWKARSRSSPIALTLQATVGSGSSPSASTARSSIVVGWTNPEGSRSHIGALLLGYYTQDGRLRYAGRAGTGVPEKELKRLAAVLKPLRVPKMPLTEPPPRDSRFGSPLKLSRVHWVKPEVVAESDLSDLVGGQFAAAGRLSGAAR